MSLARTGTRALFAAQTAAIEAAEPVA
jgi:hypothetical protein